MQHLQDSSSFEHWVTDIFDRPVGASCLCSTELDHLFDSPVTALEWRTRLFREAGARLRQYSDEQVALGLDHLSSHVHSDDMLALADSSAPGDVRARCLESFLPLFRDVFASRCTTALPHGPDSSRNTLNGVCYMWWDAMDYYPGPADPARRPVDLIAVEVMGRLLELDSVPCKESALHGLGHWRKAYPDIVEPILDAALAQAQGWPAELLAYAQRARWHYVL